MSSAKALFFRLVLLGVSLSLVLLAGECVVRRVKPQMPSVWDNTRDGMTVHWPNLDVYLPKFDQRIQTNSIGMRDREHPVPKPPGTHRIFVFGDSFMEALQVPFDASFPARLEAGLRPAVGASVDIVNLSVSGWGTDDELTYLERHTAELEPNGILVMMTLHNDVADNALLEFHSLEAGKLVARPIEPMPWLQYAIQNVKAFLACRSNLYQLAYQTSMRGRVQAGAKQLDHHVAALLRRDASPEIDDSWALTLALLDRTAELARERGAWFAVGMIPLWVQVDDAAWNLMLADHALENTAMDRSAPQRRVADWATARGVTLIDLLPAFSARHRARDPQDPELLYLLHDGHWSASGHALAAEEAQRVLVTAGLGLEAAR